METKEYDRKKEQCISEEIKEGVRKYLETNESTIIKNFMGCSKSHAERKLIGVNA